MWSPGSLKVVNSESSHVLQELIAEYGNVHFSPSSIGNELLLVGYCGHKFTVLAATCPDRVKVIPFEDTISSFAWSAFDERICVTYGTDKIGIIKKVKDCWECTAFQTFNLGNRKLVACFPLPTGTMIFVRHSLNCLIVGFSENPPEWQQIARIDCIEAVEKVFVCHSPLSTPKCCIIIIGTEDGHVYQLQLSNKILTLLCDIQQPVTSILSIENQTAQTVVVGKYGKIAWLDGCAKEALISFAPTAISDCCQSGQKLYLLGSEQLYCMELKNKSDGCFLGEADFCKVKFIRAFHLKDNFVLILTENGTIYQSSPIFGSQKNQPSRQRSGAEIKPILSEIHRCSDRIKSLNFVSDRVRLDVAQLSVALHMLNQDVGDRFPIIARSFADDPSKRQRLNITITNKSTWDLSSSHWAFQISTRRTDQSFILLRQEWKKGEKLELEHHFELLDDAFEVELKMSLAFRVIDPRKESEPQSLCVFPLSTVELSVLDFLEPSASDMYEFKNSQTDMVGFSRTKVDGCPWPILLRRSWHRGFAQWLNDSPPLQIVLRFGSHPLRLTLREDENPSDKIWILRIESSNSNLLRLLRTRIFQLIEANFIPASSKSEVVTIPSHVLAHLLSLRGRLNYIQSLSCWDESDLEPIMEEIRLFMAKQFSIR